MITAKELREMLVNIPDDTPIILQTDDEGNGYRYVNGIDYEADGDGVNYFDGEECIRRSDIEDGFGFPEDPEKIVAVVY